MSLGWIKIEAPEDNSLNRATTRNRKLPVTRSADFFMVNNPRPNNTFRVINNDVQEPLYSLLTPTVTKTNLEHSYTTKQHATNKIKTKKSGNLQLYHQNIRGLHNKIEELTTQ